MVVIGWDELPNLTATKTREALAQLSKETYPDEVPNKLSNWTGQHGPSASGFKKTTLSSFRSSAGLQSRLGVLREAILTFRAERTTFTRDRSNG